MTSPNAPFEIFQGDIVLPPDASFIECEQYIQEHLDEYATEADWFNYQKWTTLYHKLEEAFDKETT